MPGQPEVSTTEIAPPATPVTPASPVAAPVVDAPRATVAPESKAAKRVKPSPRKVGRTTKVVVRHLDAWSVLKLSLVYYLAVFLVILVAAVLLWAGAESAGVIGNFESFMVDIGFEDYRLLPGQLLRGVALGGLVLVVAGTFANVLLTALFNLMTDMVGGLRLTLQEDPGPGASSKDDGNATV